MITFIHGDDTTASRNYFFEQKKKYPNSISLDGKTLTLTQLVQNLSGDGLFSDTKIIFVEDFFTRKAGYDMEQIIDFLSNSGKGELYFWESKELGKKNLSLFKNSRNNAFMLPKSLFLFLENIRPNNLSVVALFHKTLATTPVELIFSMIIRQWRLLLAISDNPDSGHSQIDEIKRQSPWQGKKLQQQKKYFSRTQLLSDYQKIAEIERNNKTGVGALSLEQAIDIFLLNL